MNPLQFKAHPLLFRMVDMLINPMGHSIEEVLEVVLILLTITPLWAAALIPAVWKISEIRLSVKQAYLLALPAAFLYAPLLMTVLGDVRDHVFRLSERYILIIAIVIAASMLAALYGFVIREGRFRSPLGFQGGIAVALVLFLASIPYGLALLSLNESLEIL